MIDFFRGGVTAIYHNDEFLIEVNNTETNQTELIVRNVFTFLLKPLH